MNKNIHILIYKSKLPIIFNQDSFKNKIIIIYLKLEEYINVLQFIKFNIFLVFVLE